MNRTMTPALAFTPDVDDDVRTITSAVLSILDHAKRALEQDVVAAATHLAQASSILQIEAERRTGRGATAASSGGLADWRVRRVRAFIDSQFANTIHVKDLSDAVRLSPTYFCRTFKQTFGETAHAYLVRRRLDHAGYLMLSGDAPLCQVALACGFADQAHLSKLFRRRMGQSPAAWRRERREAVRESLRPDKAKGVQDVFQ